MKMSTLLFAAALAFAGAQASAHYTQPEVSLSALADAPSLDLRDAPTGLTVEAAPPVTPGGEAAPDAVPPSSPQPRSKRGILAVIMGSLFFLTGIVNVRTLKDANLSVSKALPAAAAANASDSIDLGTESAGRLECVELSVTVPATPALVDDKTITLTVKDSADNITFAAIDDLPPIVATGAGGAGAAAIDRRFKLPIGVRRYIRLDAAVLTGGGNNTGVSTTLALVF